MQSSIELIKNSIQRDLKFANISNKKISLIEWKAPGSFKNYLLDMNIIRENKINDVFFQINKLGMKIVYIRKNSIIFIIGAEDKIQYQLLEALLEEIIKRFFENDDLIKKIHFENITSDAFKSFKHDIDDIVFKFANMDLVKIIDVPCKICKKPFPLVVKKRIVEEATSFPVHVVCIHNGHPLVCYVDKDFNVRGTGLVNFTGQIVS